MTIPNYYRSVHIGENIIDSVLGVLRVDGDIGSPRFQNTQQTHNHRQRTFQTNRHQRFFPHTTPTQVMGQLVRLVVQFLIRKLLFIKYYRNRVGCFANLFGQQINNSLMGWPGNRRGCL